MSIDMAFDGLRTERLVIRSVREIDAEDLAARRNDPIVAEYQDWSVPYSEEAALAITAELSEMDGPQVDEWWMAIISDAHSGVTLGDLVLHLTHGGRTAEVGYTLAHEHWGRGIAAEALEALMAWLFRHEEMTRAFAMLHPDNVASARLLERTGFIFEAHTRSSFWKDGEVSDDHIYAMLREDWQAWRDRPRSRPSQVRLTEITTDNQSSVFRLGTHKTQERFVAPMAWSYADALFPEVVDGAPVVPWMRAIEADDEVVGFVMLAEMTEHHADPYLWRLLVDRMHQRRGIGSEAMDLVESRCLAVGADAIVTSWVQGRGSPEPFYLGRGYEPTGRIVDGEIEGRKRLG